DYVHNSFGDLLQTDSESGLRTSNTYDGLGRVKTTTTESTLGGGEDYGTQIFTYNGLSQVETVTAPAVTNPISNITHQSVTTTTYDYAGRKVSETTSDAIGGDDPRTTTWTYDAVGRPISVTRPDGSVITRQWNS